MATILLIILALNVGFVLGASWRSIHELGRVWQRIPTQASDESEQIEHSQEPAEFDSSKVLIFKAGKNK